MQLHHYIVKNAIEDTKLYIPIQVIGILENSPIYVNSSLCSTIENTSVTEVRQTPTDISWINTRQLTQITYAALYKHLALLPVTVYSCVST